MVVDEAFLLQALMSSEDDRTRLALQQSSEPEREGILRWFVEEVEQCARVNIGKLPCERGKRQQSGIRHGDWRVRDLENVVCEEPDLALILIIVELIATVDELLAKVAP